MILKKHKKANHKKFDFKKAQESKWEEKGVAGHCVKLAIQVRKASPNNSDPSVKGALTGQG